MRLALRRVLELMSGEWVPVKIESLSSSTLYRAGKLLVIQIQGAALRGTGEASSHAV